VQVEEHPTPGTAVWTAVAMLALLLLLLKLTLAVEGGGDFVQVGVYKESPLRPLLQAAILAPVAVGVVHCIANLRRTVEPTWALPMVGFLLVVPALLLAWGAEGPPERYPYDMERPRCVGGGVVPPVLTDAMEPFVIHATPLIALLTVAAGASAWFRPQHRAVGIWLLLGGLTGVIAWHAAGVLYSCP
jgi:hypothetical protein